MSCWVVATLACAAAPTIAVLTAARVAQGISAGVAIAMARVVISDLDPVNLTRHLSRMMLVLAAVPVLAPTIGGFALMAGGWRFLFVLLAAVGVVFTLVAWRQMPESLHPDERVRRHSVLARYGELLRNRRFQVPVLGSALGMGIMFAYIGESSFVFRDGYGFGEIQYGLLFGCNAVALIAGFQLSPWLQTRLGDRRLVATAGVVGACSALTMPLSSTLAPGQAAPVVVALMLVLGSAGLIVPVTSARALLAMPEHRTVASGLMGACQFFLGALVGALPAMLDVGGPAAPLGLTAAAALAVITVTAARPVPVVEPAAMEVPDAA
ncbi:MFS transporter [Nocardioides bruguierae]|uniref:MFS transporter n=1 Tax=Nocardioides bruguierae TaxID=2945102 RepID=A0A9X2D3U9_9ACTN|nr:MFS transporter [Nocardioides bruguierae]MCM0618852.1 MFS transporter [Nocardioides bruguierae]